MGEMVLSPEARAAIDSYMNSREPVVRGIEVHCSYAFQTMIERKIHWQSPIVRLKWEKPTITEWDKKCERYFNNSDKVHFSRFGAGYPYKYRSTEDIQSVMFFQDQAESIIGVFIADKYETIENAVRSTDTFIELWNGFVEWFEERRVRFLKEMETAIAEIKKFQMSEKPQSHGGVANLLKVLTKTMEKQGADITNIAKVQYAVCIQAGIYIPDEFVQDVAVAMNILEKEEKEPWEK